MNDSYQWSESDDATLREHGGVLTALDLAAVLDRSPRAINRRLKTLGIARCTQRGPRSHRERSRQVAAGHEALSTDLCVAVCGWFAERELSLPHDELRRNIVPTYVPDSVLARAGYVREPDGSVRRLCEDEETEPPRDWRYRDRDRHRGPYRVQMSQGSKGRNSQG